MRYKSTRGEHCGASFADVVLSGYAPDGGLWVPESIPNVDRTQLLRMANRLKDGSAVFSNIAAELLSLFTGDTVPLEALQGITHEAFASFAASDVLPIKAFAGESFVLLEAFHGPTLAFKDVGLQCLARIANHILVERNERAVVCVETSGDTGPAALSAVKGLPNLDILCLFPDGRVSDVQELQMTTIQNSNVHVYRTVGGNTDDQAAALKDIFIDEAFCKEHRVVSFNSINWTRRAFGNCMAGVLAKRMGLPIGRMLAATNANDIVHRALGAGDFSLGNNVATTSPAMDIQLPYNVERFLFYCADEDGAVIKNIMSQLEATGKTLLGATLLKRVQQEFDSVAVSDADTAETITRVWKSHSYCLCPHSAIAVHAVQAQRHLLPSSKVVCVATAHPAKFLGTCEAAVGTKLPAVPLVEKLRTMPTNCLALAKTAGDIEWKQKWISEIRSKISEISASKNRISKL